MKSVRTLFLALCLVAVLCSCAAPPPAGVQPPATPATQDAPASSANIARAAVEPSAFLDLDPSAACTAELWILNNVYETLTRYTPTGSAEAIEPGLATSWSASDDGLTWTFHLREGVTFHDGAAFDASAVKQSVERTQRLGQCAAYLFEPISEIETPDPYTVVFKLSQPAPLDAIMASPYSAWITSPLIADKDAAWFAAGNEAGTGPYRYERYEPGQRLVVQRYEDYWGGWEPGQFDTIIFELLDDSVVAEQMLRAGQLDFVNQLIITPDQMAGLDGVEGLRLDTASSVANWIINLNHRRAPTNDVRVRQALAYSFPYTAVVANAVLGKGTLAHGAVPAGVWGQDPEPQRYIEDLDKARSLLEEAGYGDGMEITFSYDPPEEPTAELWQANLAKIGVTLNLEPADITTRWEPARRSPELAPEAFMLRWAPDIVDPYSYLFNLFHSEEEPLWNMGFYNDPAFDALLEQARLETVTDPAAATDDYIAAQRMLADDAAAIYALDVPELNIIAGDIQGYVTNPAYSHMPYWYDLRREQ